MQHGLVLLDESSKAVGVALLRGHRHLRRAKLVPGRLLRRERKRRRLLRQREAVVRAGALRCPGHHPVVPGHRKRIPAAQEGEIQQRPPIKTGLSRLT